MFSTILKEASGYFDRRALISAFFPSFVFWSLTLILVLSKQIGWSAAIKQWEGLGGTLQGILLIGFFIWVAFWSFLTINFRTAIVRLYEGYGWDIVPYIGSRLEKQRRRYWQQRWDDLDSDDRQLETQAVDLLREINEYKQLQKALPNPLPPDPQPNNINVDLIKQNLNTSLNNLMSSLPTLNIEALSTNEFQELKNVRDLWLQLLPHWQQLSETEKQSYREQLNKVSESLTKLVEAIAAERQDLSYELFLNYPPQRANIMPTQMGNVLKAAEMYPQKRYNLDAVVIWTRLQSSLPKEFVEPLQDAKTSLDLMVTLSAYMVLFGLPLSTWMAVQSVTLLSWWMPLLMVVLAISLRFNVLFVLALVALVLTFVSPQTPTLIASNLIHLQVFLTLICAVLLAAWMSYQNAVQAAVAYGEKIKTAFDLYRWKALDGLQLQLPPNLIEERQLWDDVCGLLYRSYSPDPRYYRYVKQTNTKDPISPPATVRLPVPKKLLAADHLITADDITEIEMLEDEIEMLEERIPGDVVRERSALIGCCPLQSLPAREPILMSVLTHEKYLKDKIAVSIRATPAMTLGGQLKAGDIVNIISMPAAADTTTPAPTPSVWRDILVLDVRSVAAQESDKLPDYPFVVIIALPESQHEEFATRTLGATMLINRKL